MPNGLLQRPSHFRVRQRFQWVHFCVLWMCLGWCACAIGSLLTPDRSTPSPWPSTMLLRYLWTWRNELRNGVIEQQLHFTRAHTIETVSRDHADGAAWDPQVTRWEKNQRHGLAIGVPFLFFAVMDIVPRLTCARSDRLAILLDKQLPRLWLSARQHGLRDQPATNDDNFGSKPKNRDGGRTFNHRVLFYVGIVARLGVTTSRPI